MSDETTKPIEAVGSDIVDTEESADSERAVGADSVADTEGLTNPELADEAVTDVGGGAESTDEASASEPIKVPIIITPTPIIESTVGVEAVGTESTDEVSEPVATPATTIISTPVESIPVIQPPVVPVSVLDRVSLSFRANMLRARELLVKANNAIQFKRKKKLDKIMTLFDKKRAPTHIGNQIGVGEVRIKNRDVRDLLHVSDPTATNYLAILIKQDKIRREGKNKGVYYTKN